MKLRDELIELDACSDAVGWVEDRDLPKAWVDCERGDWMLWYTAKKNIDHKLLFLCACKCARRVLHLVPLGEDRPLMAIEAAEAWVDGEIHLSEVRAAAYAAADVADAFYTVADAASRYAARATAYVAVDASYTARVSAYAAAFAADVDARVTAYTSEQKAQADIVRGIIDIKHLQDETEHDEATPLKKDAMEADKKDEPKTAEDWTPEKVHAEYERRKDKKTI